MATVVQFEVYKGSQKKFGYVGFKRRRNWMWTKEHREDMPWTTREWRDMGKCYLRIECPQMNPFALGTKTKSKKRR